MLLTAKDDVEDKLKGLDSGADDYLVKPFAFSELVAKVKSAFAGEKLFLKLQEQVGNLVMDTNQRGVAEIKKSN